MGRHAWGPEHVRLRKMGTRVTTPVSLQLSITPRSGDPAGAVPTPLVLPPVGTTTNYDPNPVLPLLPAPKPNEELQFPTDHDIGSFEDEEEPGSLMLHWTSGRDGFILSPSEFQAMVALEEQLAHAPLPDDEPDELDEPSMFGAAPPTAGGAHPRPSA